MSVYRSRQYPLLCPKCGSYKVGEPEDGPHGDCECWSCGFLGTERQFVRRPQRGEEPEERGHAS